VTTRDAADLVVAGTFSAPGLARVLVDGKLIDGFALWDYTPDSWGAALGPRSLRLAGVRVPVGKDITVTIELSYFAHPDWKVEVGEDPNS
jgi:hypothetical protein